MFQKLLELQKKAYAPYSKYKVSAIAVDSNGIEYFGVNVENASYGLTSCAERNSIFNAVSKGQTKIKELHLLCSDKKSFGVPCGACRQVMAEFMSDGSYIFIYNILGEIQKIKIEEMLPYTFRNHFFNKE